MSIATCVKNKKMRFGCYVSTDKQRYKPGETAHVRVVFLNTFTHQPCGNLLSNAKFQISIKDGSGSIIFGGTDHYLPSITNSTIAFDWIIPKKQTGGEFEICVDQVNVEDLDLKEKFETHDNDPVDFTETPITIDIPPRHMSQLKKTGNKITKTGAYGWNSFAFITLDKTKKIQSVKVKIDKSNVDASGLFVGIGSSYFTHLNYWDIASVSGSRGGLPESSCDDHKYAQVGSVYEFSVDREKDEIVMKKNGKFLGVNKKKPSTFGNGDLVFMFIPCYTGNQITVFGCANPIFVSSGKRKIDIVTYRAPKFRKDIRFLRKGFGEGDTVKARLVVEKNEGGFPQNCTVEAIARVDSVEVFKQKYALDKKNGTCFVTFKLPLKITEGNGNLSCLITDGITETASKTIPIILKKLKCRVYPEGGNLVIGCRNGVYFESETLFGDPADFEGELVEKSSNRVVTSIKTEHEGRGYFSFVPEKEKSYEIRVVEPAGVTIPIELPEIREHGFSLLLKTKKNEFGKPFEISLCSTEDIFVKVLLAKKEKIISISDVVELTKNNAMGMKIDTKDVDGVVRISVYFVNPWFGLDSFEYPIAERLIFIKPKEEITWKIETERNEYSPGDTVNVKVKPMIKDKSVEAFCSLSVTNDSILKMVEKRSRQPLLKEMVYLEDETLNFKDTEAYFDPEKEIGLDFVGGDEAIDLLLGTQGWRRFIYKWYSKDEKFYENMDEFRSFDKDAFFRILNIPNPAIAKAQIFEATKLMRPTKTSSSSSSARSKGASQGRVVIDKLNVPTPEKAMPQKSLFSKVDLKKLGNESRKEKERQQRAVVERAAQKKRQEVERMRRREEERTRAPPPQQQEEKKRMAVERKRMERRERRRVEGGERKRKEEERRPRRYEEERRRRVEIERRMYELKRMEEEKRKRYEEEKRRKIEEMKRRIKSIVEFAHKNKSANNVRNDFTETVYFNSSTLINQKNAAGEYEKTFTFELCDSITSFRVVLNGWTSFGAIGSDKKQSIVSKKPFWVDVKLPIEISIPDKVLFPAVVVNNQKGSAGNASLSVEEIGEVQNLDFGKDVKITMSVKEFERKVHYFEMNAKTQKMVDEAVATVKVSGKLNQFTDEMSKKVKIVPYGFPTFYVFSGNLKKKGDKEEYLFKLPERYVPHSFEATSYVTPTTLGGFTTALKSLIRQPGGCFEQVSSSMYPMVMAVNFFNSNETQLDQDLLSGIEKNLEIGYNKLKNYEIKTGGFDWYGKPPSNESLSALGLVQFIKLSNVFPVDKKLIERTRNWLLSRRKEDNSGFRRNSGRYAYGHAPELTTDSYILWCVSQSGVGYEIVEKLLENVKKSALSTRDHDCYVLSLLSLAYFNFGKLNESKELIKFVLPHILPHGEVKKSNSTITRSGGINNSLETTALSSLALQNFEEFADYAGSCIDFIMKKNRCGNYGSTQSTCLCIQAIVKYFSSSKGSEEGSVMLKINGNLTDTAVITKASSKELYFDAAILSRAISLDENTENKIEIVSNLDKPIPFAFFIALKVEKPDSRQEELPFYFSTKIENSVMKEGETTEIEVVLRNKKEDEPLPMIIAIVSVPSGLTARLKKLKELKKMGKYEYFELFGNRNVVFYWYGMKSGEEIKFKFDVIAEIPGTYVGDASRAYLYYDNDVKFWVEGLKIQIDPRK